MCTFQFVPLSCDTTSTPFPHPNEWQQLQSTADVLAQPPAVGVTNHDSTGTRYSNALVGWIR
ncbi:hypothetical protein JB92DRAFT_3031466 [Gautieria morchelliformis]|nr:hypothetical protein JB92DRAFT_3031466 [Gautieria morchelliformis]